GCPWPVVRNGTMQLHSPSQLGEWSCIVPFRTTGQGQPIFCLHGGTGNVNVYEYFSNAIGDRYPVYGVRALGNWGTQEPLETVEEMAAYYADEILRVQPEGPFVFFGYSLGGLVALELAHV